MKYVKIALYNAKCKVSTDKVGVTEKYKKPFSNMQDCS